MSSLKDAHSSPASPTVRASTAPSPVNDPDTALLVSIAAGDARAARVFVDRHLQRLMNLARRVLGNQADAEDVAQEVFLRVWKQAPKWKPGGAKFETWMHRVALNLCYDLLRKKRELTGDAMPEAPDERAHPGEALQNKQLAARVEAALQSLPERQRVAVTLCHHLGYTNIEAADVLDVSVEAVESLLARGRRTLKDLLRADMNELTGGGQ